MTVMDERELLRACRSNAPEAALGQIVQRHIDLVYAAALRQVRDPHLAEDVTQAVFLVLCRKPRAAQRSKSLAGWLLTVTRYTAVDAMRRQMRQQRHEKAAARAEVVETAEFWPGIAPVLDEALSKLRTTDRDAIVLRFFQEQPLVEVGRSLGIGEEAARKRVSRALEKLQILLKKRGVKVALAALGTGIAANATQAAPSHLTSVVTAAVIGDGVSASSASAALAKGAIVLMAWGRAKVVFAAMGLFVICGSVLAVVMNVTKVETPVRDVPVIMPSTRGTLSTPGVPRATQSPTAAGVPQSRPAGKRNNSTVGER